MRQLYGDRIFEGIGFSHNGKRAYLRGEKPMFMWPPEMQSMLHLEATDCHHIERRVGSTWKRSLVMFFREIKIGPIRIHELRFLEVGWNGDTLIGTPHSRCKNRFDLPT